MFFLKKYDNQQLKGDLVFMDPMHDVNGSRSFYQSQRKPQDIIEKVSVSAGIIGGIAVGIIGGLAIGTKTGLLAGVAAGFVIIVLAGERLKSHHKAHPEYFDQFERKVREMVANVKSYLKKCASQSERVVADAKASVARTLGLKKPTKWERLKELFQKNVTSAENKLNKAHRALDGVTQTLADDISRVLE